MSGFHFFRLSKPKQYVYSVSAVLLVAGICFLFSDILDYHVVALLLLVTVSLAAVSFDIRPVLLAAALSALIWDIFFIPPRFTYVVNKAEDLVLLAMYFIIALFSAVLTARIRGMESLARQQQDKTREVTLYNTILNSLSHELRTPIATIIGATDNLQENDDKLSAANRAILLQEIGGAAFRLNQQVENLLNISRLESGFLQPRKDWTDIGELIHHILRQFDPSASLHRIEKQIGPNLPLFRLDKGMLEQVLYNLVNNALVHTPPGSIVFVYASHIDNGLELVVEDNGPGFPETAIPRVFDKFYRLKDTGITGTGLGLSIVKGFTEAMGGTVMLENRPSGGARFIVRLPADSSPSIIEHE